MISAALTLWGSTFHEKDGWRGAVRFIVLLIAAVALSSTTERIMPMLEDLCSAGTRAESLTKYALALTYTGALTMMVVAGFYIIVLDGLLGGSVGWLRGVGCVLTGLIIALPTLRLGLFVVKSFWWLALAVIAILAIIGAVIGPSFSSVKASSDGNTFVDRYGNEYISSTEQSRIYNGDATWDTTRAYHIKGQSGTFYRRIK